MIFKKYCSEENEDEDVIVDKLLRTVWSWTRAQLKRRGGEWTLNLIFLFVFVMAIVIRPSALARIGLISFNMLKSYSIFE